MAANVSLLIWVHWLLVCDPSAHQSSLREAIRLLDLGRMRKHASRLMRGWLGRFTIESIKVSSRARLVRDLRVVPHWPSVLPSSSGRGPDWSVTCESFLTGLLFFRRHLVPRCDLSGGLSHSRPRSEATPNRKEDLQNAATRWTTQNFVP